MGRNPALTSGFSYWRGAGQGFMKSSFTRGLGAGRAPSVRFDALEGWAGARRGRSRSFAGDGTASGLVEGAEGVPGASAEGAIGAELAGAGLAGAGLDVGRLDDAGPDAEGPGNTDSEAPSPGSTGCAGTGFTTGARAAAG
jgi:hypothetical protein